MKSFAILLIACVLAFTLMTCDNATTPVLQNTQYGLDDAATLIAMALSDATTSQGLITQFRMAIASAAERNSFSDTSFELQVAEPSNGCTYRIVDSVNTLWYGIQMKHALVGSHWSANGFWDDTASADMTVLYPHPHRSLSYDILGSYNRVFRPHRMNSEDSDVLSYTISCTYWPMTVNPETEQMGLGTVWVTYQVSDAQGFHSRHAGGFTCYSDSLGELLLDGVSFTVDVKRGMAVRGVPGQARQVWIGSSAMLMLWALWENAPHLGLTLQCKQASQLADGTFPGYPVVDTGAFDMKIAFADTIRGDPPLGVTSYTYLSHLRGTIDRTSHRLVLNSSSNGTSNDVGGWMPAWVCDTSMSTIILEDLATADSFYVMRGSCRRSGIHNFDNSWFGGKESALLQRTTGDPPSLGACWYSISVEFSGMQVLKRSHHVLKGEGSIELSGWAVGIGSFEEKATFVIGNGQLQLKMPDPVCTEYANGRVFWWCGFH